MVEPLWDFDSLILGGGRSSRMGKNKALLSLGEGPLLRRAVLGTLEAGSRLSGVIAPERVFDRLFEEPNNLPVLQALEDPPHGGPVAGVAAGLTVLESHWKDEGGPPQFVAVLACDLPGAPRAIGALVSHAHQWVDVEGLAGFVGVDEEGWTQPLLTLYSTAHLREVLTELRETREWGVRNVAARRLLDKGRFVRVPLPELLTADVDTTEDVERYRKLEAKIREAHES